MPVTELMKYLIIRSPFCLDQVDVLVERAVCDGSVQRAFAILLLVTGAIDKFVQSLYRTLYSVVSYCTFFCICLVII